MIEGFKASDQLLYHYTKMSTARHHIFKTGRMKMNSFRAMNDPKESRTWKFNLSGANCGKLTCKEWDELGAKLSTRFKDHARGLCFCQDVGPLTGDHLAEISRRGFARPRMWAQYAETHTGICLVFDRAKLSRQVALACVNAFALLQGKVAYQDRHIAPDLLGHYEINLDRLTRLGFERYWQEHATQYCGRLFFEKNADWRDEWEYRFVAFFPDTPEIYVDMADALVGVIFGTEAKPEDEDEIIKVLWPTKVRLMGLKWENATPWYDYRNFKYDRQLSQSPWGEAQRRAKNVPT